jgi:hypothetical protein
MAGPGKLSWDSVEVWQKLVAAIIASGVRVSLHNYSRSLSHTCLTTSHRSTLATSRPTSAPPTTPSRTASAQSRSKPKSSKTPLATALKTKSLLLERAQPSRALRRSLPALTTVRVISAGGLQRLDVLISYSCLKRPRRQEHSIWEGFEEEPL